MKGVLFERVSNQRLLPTPGGHIHGQFGNTKNNPKNNNQQRWQWNDAIVLREKKLTVTGWLEVTMRTKNIKMNGMA